MKFYGRETELAQLRSVTAQSASGSKMTVITGRRRVGKTLLARKACRHEKALYLFVAKKTEALICTEFVDIIKNNFDVPVFGEIQHFRDVFRLLMEIGKTHPYVLIIDEFQEFYRINPAVYSEIQNLWDQYRQQTRIHLMFIGSVYSLMVKIFQNHKEPLFGRADRILYLKPFKPQTIQQILQHAGQYSAENLFFCYLLTGGIPRYLEILHDNGVYGREAIIDFVLSKNSPFLEEGKHLLIEEFGKEYATYFSILELLASGKTGRGELESILAINIGGHLKRLQENYDVIAVRKPINAKPDSKVQKYFIKDNFLNFWFRFIYRNNSAVETENFAYIKRILERDLSTYSGMVLERLFHVLLADTGRYNQIGSYWERGNQNEIDVVAVNDLDKQVLVGEVKMNPDRIRIPALQHKAAKLEQAFAGYTFEYQGFSMEAIDQYVGRQD
jgi:AAA+ ATPase superfamily predicted ATPase